jgi:hypothetical protein
MFYILDSHKKVKKASPSEWLTWFSRHIDDGRRIVAQTARKKILVSTVFLGLGYRRSLIDGRPLVFETMVIGDSSVRNCTVRYPTWKDAEAGHRAMVATVLGSSKGRQVQPRSASAAKRKSRRVTAPERRRISRPKGHA